MKKVLLILSVLVVLVFTSCDFLFAPTGIRLVNNNSSLDVWYVYITPSTESSWGPDMLGDSEVIQPGNSRLFRLGPDTYDILVVFQDGSGGAYPGISVSEREEREVSIDDSSIELTKSFDTRVDPEQLSKNISQ